VENFEFKTLTKDWAVASNNETTFDNIGGSAVLKDDELTLVKVVPGDAVRFNIVVENNSNVTVKCRTIISCENNNGLFAGLKVKVGDVENYSGMTLVSNWATVNVGSNAVTVPVVVELPEDAGNEYQNKTCTVSYKVEAVQGNAKTVDPEAGIIYVYNANDLSSIANQVNTGADSYYGKEIRLANSIDLGGVNWTPIGSNGYVFQGLFDGQENTISNFKVEAKEYAGLFGYANNGGDFKNLTVAKANIKANDRAGAILGAGYSTLVNCHAEECEIIVTPYFVEADGVYDGGAKAGGVVGQLFEGATNGLTDCTATKVEVTGYRDIGAVLGMAHNNNVVTDCSAKD
jgi:hypothetical protein